MEQIIKNDDLETFTTNFKDTDIMDYLKFIFRSDSEKIFEYLLLEKIDINMPIDYKPCGRIPITCIIEVLVYEERDNYLKIIKDLRLNISKDIVELLERNPHITNSTLDLVLDIYIKRDPDEVIEIYNTLKSLDSRYEKEDVYKIFRYKFLDLSSPHSHFRNGN